MIDVKYAGTSKINIQSFRCKARPLRPRKRPQRFISRTFYANNRWLRRPGPWPGAEAVTMHPHMHLHILYILCFLHHFYF